MKFGTRRRMRGGNKDMIQVLFVNHASPDLAIYSGKFHMSIKQFKESTKFVEMTEMKSRGAYTDCEWNYTTTKTIRLNTEDPEPVDLIVGMGTTVTLHRRVSAAVDLPVAPGIHPIDLPVYDDKRFDGVAIRVTIGKIHTVKGKRRITLKPSKSRESPTSANSPVFV